MALLLVLMLVIACPVAAVMVTAPPARSIPVPAASATTMVLTTMVYFLMERRWHSWWPRIRILRRGVVGSARVMGIRLAKVGTNCRYRFMLVALTNGGSHVRVLRATSIAVPSSTTSAACIMPLLRCALMAPVGRGRLRRGLVRVSVLLRRTVRRLLGVLRRGVQLRSKVWMVVGWRDWSWSVRVCVGGRRVGMLGGPLLRMRLIGDSRGV